MSSGEARKRTTNRWVCAAALLLGLLLFTVGVLHVKHGNYVLAPPSFLVAVLLVVVGVRRWRRTHSA